MATVAILLAHGFEDAEFRVPYKRLLHAGHAPVIVGETAGQRLTSRHRKESAVIDTAAVRLYPSSFDLVLIPGGHSPERLRLQTAVVSFLQGFFETGRLVAAISSGPALLIEAEIVEGRMLTSAPAIRKDLENAGAGWADQEVVVDGNLITARGAEDLPSFCNAIFTRLAPVFGPSV